MTYVYFLLLLLLHEPGPAEAFFLLKWKLFPAAVSVSKLIVTKTISIQLDWITKESTGEDWIEQACQNLKHLDYWQKKSKVEVLKDTQLFLFFFFFFNLFFNVVSCLKKSESILAKILLNFGCWPDNIQLSGLETHGRSLMLPDVPRQM